MTFQLLVMIILSPLVFFISYKPLSGNKVVWYEHVIFVLLMTALTITIY